MQGIGNKADGENLVHSLWLIQLRHVKGEKIKAICVGTLLVSNRKWQLCSFLPNPSLPTPRRVGVRKCSSITCNFSSKGKLCNLLLGPTIRMSSTLSLYIFLKQPSIPLKGIFAFLTRERWSEMEALSLAFYN